MTETPTRDEIRAAVDYGQTLAVRRILDALAKGQALGRWYTYDWQAGYAGAVQIVKAYRVGQDEEGNDG